MKQRLPHKLRQPDLFPAVTPVKVVPAGAQKGLLLLVSALLREATGQVKEVDHEDYA